MSAKKPPPDAKQPKQTHGSASDRTTNSSNARSNNRTLPDPPSQLSGGSSRDSLGQTSASASVAVAAGDAEPPPYGMKSLILVAFDLRLNSRE